MSRRSIVRHEAKLLRREASWWLALGLLFVCVAYAWTNGASFRKERAAETTSEVAAARDHLENERAAVAAGEPGGFSGRAGSARTVAVAPVGRLADFTIGQSDLYPYSAEISPFRRLDDLFRNYQLQSPLTLLSGRFDLGFVVVYLLPLLLIGLSFNMLSGEREQGTLPIVLSQPLGVRELLSAKLIARALLVLGPFLLLAAVAFLASADLSAERFALFALWSATAAAYGLFWLAVVGFVNATGRRSETNAVILACVWLIVVVVVPASLNVLIRDVAPTPSRLSYVSEMRAATTEASRSSAELLAGYYEDHPELAAGEMQARFLPAYFAQQRQIERTVQPIVARFESRLEEQQGLVRVASLLSPAVLVQETFQDVAGTGLSRQRQFTEQARQFLAQWHEVLRPKVFTSAEMSVDDYGRLPRFEFREERLATLTGRSAIALVVLTLLSVALLVAARRRSHGSVVSS